MKDVVLLAFLCPSFSDTHETRLKLFEINVIQ